jgi:hypothetical protein
MFHTIITGCLKPSQTVSNHHSQSHAIAASLMPSQPVSYHISALFIFSLSIWYYRYIIPFCTISASWSPLTLSLSISYHCRSLTWWGTAWADRNLSLFAAIDMCTAHCALCSSLLVFFSTFLISSHPSCSCALLCYQFITFRARLFHPIPFNLYYPICAIVATSFLNILQLILFHPNQYLCTI